MAGERWVHLPHGQALAPGCSWASWARSAHLLRGEESLERRWEGRALQGSWPGQGAGLGATGPLQSQPSCPLCHCRMPTAQPPESPAHRAHLWSVGRNAHVTPFDPRGGSEMFRGPIPGPPAPELLLSNDNVQHVAKPSGNFSPHLT